MTGIDVDLAAAIANGLRRDIRMLRRIFPDWQDVDGNPTSDNFKKDSFDNGTSMTVWLGPEDYIATIDGLDAFGVVWFAASSIFAEDLTVEYDPQPNNVRHVLVKGHAKRSKKRLCGCYNWVRLTTPTNRMTPLTVPPPLEWTDTLRLGAES